MVPVPELTPLATLVDSLGMLTSEPGTTSDYKTQRIHIHRPLIDLIVAVLCIQCC